ncbi:MAG TPA: hypothetical protein VD794_00480 [Flavisolibacter sp.]|nr:hypothetical protein [Flavisolibacter sp.]
MDSFQAFASNNGYTLSGSNRVPSEESDPFIKADNNFSITLSCPVSMNDTALYESIHFLSKAARQKTYKGRFANLEITKAM